MERHLTMRHPHSPVAERGRYQRPGPLLAASSRSVPYRYPSCSFVYHRGSRVARRYRNFRGPSVRCRWYRPPGVVRGDALDGQEVSRGRPRDDLHGVIGECAVHTGTPDGHPTSRRPAGCKPT